jgi:hypothetical protein
MALPRPLKGYSGYRVRESGELESRHKGDWVELKGSLTKDGYVGYRLKSDAGAFRYCFKHRIVALAFMGETPEGKAIRFRDGDRSNCARGNLYFGPSDRRRKETRDGQA